MIRKNIASNGCVRINGGLSISSIFLSAFIVSDWIFYRKIQPSMLCKAVKNESHGDRNKKIIAVILKTSNINNFRARTTTSCIYVFSYRAIEANWTAYCIELQKLYLISILKKFHNQNMLDKISITFSLNFLKNAFFQ